VVEQPSEGGAALGRAVLVARPDRGVRADEVVERVPARGDLEQVLVAQVVQVRAGGAQVGVRERGGRVGVQVLAGVQRDQPQQTAAPVGQAPVGQVEREFDAALQPAVAVALVEPVRVVGQRPAGGGADVPGDQGSAPAGGGRTARRSWPPRSGWARPAPPARRR